MNFKPIILTAYDIAIEGFRSYGMPKIKKFIGRQINPSRKPGWITMRAAQKVSSLTVARRGDKFNVIPTNNKPRLGKLYIQRHDASSHLHYDISLVEDGSTFDLFRSAVSKRSLATLFPDSSKSTAFIRQPQHSRGVFGYNWTGTIAEGYGKGYQELVFEEPVEILRTGRDKIVFNVYQSTTNKEVVGKFAFIKQADHWLCVRRKDEETAFKFKNDFKPISNQGESNKLLPEALKQALKLKERPLLWEAKIDGSANLLKFGKKGNILYSYREGKRTKDIFHENKFPSIRDDIDPNLEDTVIRGELFWQEGNLSKGKFMTSSGKENPNLIARLSNISNPLRSRELLRDSGGSVGFMMYDLKRFRGKDCAEMTYGEKLKILDKIAERHKTFFVPERFSSIEDAWNEIVTKKGGEGIVGKLLDSKTPDEDNPDSPKWLKVKNRMDWDLKVIGWKPLRRISGKVEPNIMGKLICENKVLGIKSEVGTGFTDFQREWFARNIKNIIENDSWIRVKAHHMTNNLSGGHSLHGPSYLNPHLEKSDGESPLQEIGLYESADELDCSPYQLKSAAIRR